MSLSVPGADDLGFELIPPEDDAIDATADLNAAVASALEDPSNPKQVIDDAPQPFGYTWQFDYDAGRFTRGGTGAVRVSGLDALIEWCMVALNSARFAHPIFSDEFGITDPTEGIGDAGEEARASADDWRVAARDALIVHDRITDVSLSVEYDPLSGAILARDILVTTDEEGTIRLGDVLLTGSGEVDD